MSWPEWGNLAFSGHGDGRYNPTLSANGVDIQMKSGKKVSGTSFSAPTVAAIIARMLTANPNLTPAQIKTILQKTATNTAAADNAEGAGMLNVDKAALAKTYTAA